MVSVHEQRFFDLAREKGYSELVRSGWPDFLTTTPDRKPIAVEVKGPNDLLSKSQVRCFEALERAGIKVFVWWSPEPRTLTRWSTWFARTEGRTRG